MFKTITAVAQYLPDRFRDPQDVEAERRLPEGTPVVFPVGTRVTVTSVDHLGRFGFHPRRLIGHTGVVEDHEQVDGFPPMNLVAGLTGKNELWPMSDNDITPA